MNRDIEFRGKTKDNEWIYGYYHKETSTSIALQEYGINEINTHYIHTVIDHLPFKIEVIPETIGQYTGLKDKNGKKIFEGDIVKNEDYTLAVVYNPKTQGFVLTDKDDWLNEPTDRIYDCDDIEEKFINNFFEYNCVSYEVIGNIYENKELLEV